MVALNESFALENPELGPKNRVGNFFGQEAQSRRTNRLPAQQPRRENGHGYDETASGMFYYGYRYYDSANGRWLNRDPIEEQGGLNLYGFANNDGINQLDFLGLNVYAIDGTNFDVQNNFGAGQTFSNVWDFHQRSLRANEQSRYFGGPASSDPAQGFGDAHG